MTEFMRSLTIGSWSEKEYSALPTQDDGSEAASSTTDSTFDITPCRCSSKQWLYIIAAASLIPFALIVTTLLLFKPGPVGSFEGPFSHGKTPRPFGPVLGDHEDAGRYYFPAQGKLAGLKVPLYNVAPVHRPRTPLLIGFTEHNEMLVQVVLSYIAAGWPPEDIVVVDNSGTMDANSNGLLSRDNPFFLDYALLRSRYGVSVLQTPTLLMFAQLQNFYLRTAMAHGWQTFFWSHMDVIALSDEEQVPYQSLYERALQTLDELMQLEQNAWAVKWFAYDWLTLVNVPAWREIGQWDPMIPYYHSDCDAYMRMAFAGHNLSDAYTTAGHIFDVAAILEDPETRLFADFSPSDDQEARPNSTAYQTLLGELHEMDRAKKDNPTGRNIWQEQKTGGADEPWTLDMKGFRRSWWVISDAGSSIYERKWGSRDCGLELQGVTQAMQWKSEHPTVEDKLAAVGDASVEEGTPVGINLDNVNVPGALSTIIIGSNTVGMWVPPAPPRYV